MTIHPFEDGNGRTGKHVVNQILAHFHIKPIKSRKLPQTRLVGDFHKDKASLIKLFKFVILSQRLIPQPENPKKPVSA